MKKIATLCLLACLLACAALPAQTLRGLLREGASGAPLAGALLRLTGQGADLEARTDSSGEYRFEGLRPGYYRLVLQYADQRPLVLDEISVAAGKETVQDLLFDPALDLPLLTIAQATNRRRAQPLGEIPLTREQTLRFPATFFDPARLAMAYPGVAGNDDQANGLIVRGNNPGSLRWRIEGVDVVNPNHLPNAGTLNDLPAAASGGVLMLSAQLLDNSALLTGNFPAGYGDALGGIMDIGLRRGNTARHEFTAQAGLIGLDLAAEGPLTRRKRSSYLVNYRYSTVGLLRQMGIPLGDEDIRFQDLSFKFSFEGKKGGQLSIFGILGKNSNVFQRKDSTEAETFKDLLNIEFDGGSQIGGLSYWAPVGRHSNVRAAWVASTQWSERLAERGNLYTAFSRQYERRTGLTLSLQTRWSEQWRSGVGLLGQTSRVNTFLMPNGAKYYRVGDYAHSLQPWASTSWSSRDARLSATLGLHGHLYAIVGSPVSTSLEPRSNLVWRPAPAHQVALAWGLHSQSLPLWMVISKRENMPPPPGNEFGLMRAQQLGLQHQWQWRDNWALKTGLFWQRQGDIPLGAEPTVSLVNQTEIAPILWQRNTGAAEYKGLEISAERSLAGDWFALLGATLMDARYRAADGQWRASRWDMGHILNLTAGKEWYLKSDNPARKRRFGLNGRLNWSGGLRAMPVDVAASAQVGDTRFDTRQGFSLRQPDFVRLDLRIYWKRDLGDRRNSTFAMDFQNATAQRNVAYRFFDPLTQGVETKYQLGLIPNLSWRIEF